MDLAGDSSGFTSRDLVAFLATKKGGQGDSFDFFFSREEVRLHFGFHTVDDLVGECIGDHVTAFHLAPHGASEVDEVKSVFIEDEAVGLSGGDPSLGASCFGAIDIQTDSVTGPDIVGNGIRLAYVDDASSSDLINEGSASLLNWTSTETFQGGGKTRSFLPDYMNGG